MIHLRVLLIVFFVVQFELVNPRKVQIVRVDAECRGQNCTLIGYYTGLSCTLQEFYIKKCTEVVKEDIYCQPKINISITKCESRENLDSCQELRKFNNLDFCQSINPDNLIVNQSPFALNYKPKYKCPLKKGIYTAYNATQSLVPFSVILAGGRWYWKIHAEVFDPQTHKLLKRLNLEAQVI